jgi:hypothetical protein
LDILNEMRERVYVFDHVTSEKAQLTLDELKSCGFLWGQDGDHLTEDAEDETMYRFTKRAVTRSIVDDLYRFSSFTNTEKYLRSRRYTRTSREKCVIHDTAKCDSLLIRRLQMNILTHITTDDTNVFDKVSPICK